MSQENEELLEFLYNAPTGVAYADSGGSVLRINPYLTNLLMVLGLSPTEPVNILKFLCSLDSGFEAVMESPVVADYILATGSRRIPYLKVQAKKLGSGNLAFAVEDFSERKFLEDELARSNAAKDRLFSIIGHDLRNSIGAVTASLDLLTTSPEVFDQEGQKRLLLKLKDSSRSTYTLLENLLAWARSQQGMLRPEPVALGLSDLIRDVISFFDLMAQEKGIEIRAEYADDVCAYADAEMTKTILRNLLSNACKFTPEKGRISLAWGMNDEFVCISVSDTGVGIEPGRLASLFEIEKNKSTVGTAGEHGSSLGLMLCREYARKNGGDISVESELGRGSVFRLRLPAAAPE